MNSENTENTQTIDQVIEEITQNTETVNVPIKKPRKPLTEESKMKRRETLQKARQAKLDKLKAPKPVVEKPIEKPIEKPVAKKSEYEKYMKKIDKEIMIEKLVDEKFRKYMELENKKKYDIRRFF